MYRTFIFFPAQRTIVEKLSTCIEHDHKENFLEELEEFEDNIKLEEALLLNQAMMLQKDAANNEKKQMWLDTVGGALNNYKYIREAINRVQSD